MSGGDPAAARRYYEDGLTIAKRLADAAPENADYARDLSVSYNKLGDLAMSGGDPAAARRYYEDGLTIGSGWPTRPPRTPTTPATCGCRTGGWRIWPRNIPKREAVGRGGAGRPMPCRDDRPFGPARRPTRVSAQIWWRRAYDVLSGMKRRGVFLSPEDEGFLDQLARKVGR